MYIFGFDFSMAKPAMCFYDTKDDHMEFYCWPSDVDEKTISILSNANVNVFNRGLCPISKKTFTNNIELVKEHTKRAADLSDMILSSMKEILNNKNCNDLSQVYVCSEGLSFGSTGNAALDLSGYKYTLLTTLYKYGIKNIYTYSPIAIKNVAGCSKKDKWTKDFMINAIKETTPKMHKFIEILQFNEQDLKKKTSFVKCVDDLVDSYWATRTFCEKEEIPNKLY